MDNISLPNQPAPKKQLHLIFVIVFEVFFVALLLGVIIVLLNFFNVLRISRVYSPLSFLPHLLEKNQPSSVGINPTPTPFPYNGKNAQELLQQYIHQSIQSSYIPTKLTVTHKLSAHGQANGTEYTYGSIWTIGNEQFQAFFHYNPQSNVQLDNDILINISQTTTTSEVASLLKKYFLSAPSSVNCKTFSASISACETFSTGKGFKEGIGAVLTAGHTPPTHLFRCYLPEKSERYSWKSCLSEYKDTGL